ncbi:YEATS domain-containing protein 2 [Smittium culicis]|uniref:YEATS domain-containing protein 2 n=1 Tax=Smittium culicis TaxID=133412 RepID=A0A1R1X7N9_9FUNG|nr:YEATS domain-containing protein 2 [Smittium culicis]
MPPFELDRTGWGEFPIRIQIFFIDRRNKPVNLVHILKLDDTYSIKKVLGSEQEIDLELNKVFNSDMTSSSSQPPPLITATNQGSNINLNPKSNISIYQKKRDQLSLNPKSDLINIHAFNKSLNKGKNSLVSEIKNINTNMTKNNFHSNSSEDNIDAKSKGVLLNNGNLMSKVPDAQLNDSNIDHHTELEFDVDITDEKESNKGSANILNFNLLPKRINLKIMDLGRKKSGNKTSTHSQIESKFQASHTNDKAKDLVLSVKPINTSEVEKFLTEGLTNAVNPLKLLSAEILFNQFQEKEMIDKIEHTSDDPISKDVSTGKKKNEDRKNSQSEVQIIKKPEPRVVKTPREIRETLLDAENLEGIVGYARYSRNIEKLPNDFIQVFLSLVIKYLPITVDEYLELNIGTDDKANVDAVLSKKRDIKNKLVLKFGYIPADNRNEYEKEFSLGRKLSVDVVRSIKLYKSLVQSFEGSIVTDLESEINADEFSDPDEILSCVTECLDLFGVKEHEVEKIVHSVLISKPIDLAEIAKIIRDLIMLQNGIRLSKWLRKYGFIGVEGDYKRPIIGESKRVQAEDKFLEAGAEEHIDDSFTDPVNGVEAFLEPDLKKMDIKPGDICSLALDTQMILDGNKFLSDSVEIVKNSESVLSKGLDIVSRPNHDDCNAESSSNFAIVKEESNSELDESLRAVLKEITSVIEGYPMDIDGEVKVVDKSKDIEANGRSECGDNTIKEPLEGALKIVKEAKDDKDKSALFKRVP